ncbi:hypothetical protein SPI_07227 [Niveomyces insectorum RCEF 264]|uniref:Uncharacterized protein n=1 Tax=Niveomyces insectorum RCEF 264 TaxID=1081102 RepID=A0A167QEJ3_9HYPO|nr:hypothetical protein SPI_07227 [Niveomyces insectorum RCEF 264]
MHDGHCIDQLRQLIICAGDATPVPVKWHAAVQRSYVNSDVAAHVPQRPPATEPYSSPIFRLSFLTTFNLAQIVRGAALRSPPNRLHVSAGGIGGAHNRRKKAEDDRGNVDGDIVVPGVYSTAIYFFSTSTASTEAAAAAAAALAAEQNDQMAAERGRDAATRAMTMLRMAADVTDKVTKKEGAVAGSEEAAAWWRAARRRAARRRRRPVRWRVGRKSRTARRANSPPTSYNSRDGEQQEQ